MSEKVTSRACSVGVPTLSLPVQGGASELDLSAAQVAWQTPRNPVPPSGDPSGSHRAAPQAGRQLKPAAAAAVTAAQVGAGGSASVGGGGGGGAGLDKGGLDKFKSRPGLRSQPALPPLQMHIRQDTKVEAAVAQTARGPQKALAAPQMLSPGALSARSIRDRSLHPSLHTPTPAQQPPAIIQPTQPPPQPPPPRGGGAGGGQQSPATGHRRRVAEEVGAGAALWSARAQLATPQSVSSWVQQANLDQRSTRRSLANPTSPAPPTHQPYLTTPSQPYPATQPDPSSTAYPFNPTMSPNPQATGPSGRAT